MLKVLFSAKPEAWAEYEAPLLRAFAAQGIAADLACEHDPSEVDYIVFAPNGPVTDFTPFIKTKAVMSLWAGVETVVGNQTLTQPLARMVDHGLTQGMVEWVVGHTLRHHLGMDAHILGQDGVWRPLPAARSRPSCDDPRTWGLGRGLWARAFGAGISDHRLVTQSKRCQRHQMLARRCWPAGGVDGCAGSDPFAARNPCDGKHP